jgi:hypothetical protein
MDGLSTLGGSGAGKLPPASGKRPLAPRRLGPDEVDSILGRHVGEDDLDQCVLSAMFETTSRRTYRTPSPADEARTAVEERPADLGEMLLNVLTFDWLRR